MEKTEDVKGAGMEEHRRQSVTQLHHRGHSHEPAPNHWFQRRKAAAREILEASGGSLELASSVYRGDEHHHAIHHRACGRTFWGSLAEVRAKAARICPFCHETADLRQIGRMEEVQQYVLKASDGRVYFFANNALGPVSESYKFFCFVHGPFAAPFCSFLSGRGGTNGCPRCEQPTPRSRERRGNVIFL